MDYPEDGESAVSGNQTGRAKSMKNEGSITHGLQGVSKGQELCSAGPQTHRPVSPVPSCVSMRSDWSKEGPPNLSRGPPLSDPKTQTHRPVSPVPSCVSMKSDWSKEGPPNLSRGPPLSDPNPQTHRPVSPVPSCVSMKSDWSKEGPPNLSRGPPLSDPKCEASRAAGLNMDNVTAQPGGMENTPALIGGAALLQQGGGHGTAQEVKRLKEKLQTHLRTKFSAVHQENGVKNVDDIYTDLYIVEGRTGGVNNTHEVSTINMNQIGRGPSSEDKQVKLANMFSDRLATKVLTLGIAGVGKTVAVQKFVMDWANGETNQDIDFVFVLLFRTLNLIMEKHYTFLELLLAFYMELKDLTELSEFTKCKIIFVLDGMDESRLHLDFEKCISELNVKTSVDTLMTSLIKGTLMSTAHIWVTTRPAAASLIPDECFNLVTEVRGFNDDQKDQFFQKNINNKEKADQLILYIKKNRSLQIMCHIPVFCRIIASVVDEILGDQSKEKRTLTEMYTLYTYTQMKRMNEYLDKKMGAKEKGQLLVKLGELAFKHLEKGTLIFYGKDLQDCGIDVKAGALQAGVCTQIFNVESAVAEEKIFSFVHLSVQEFLAALYVLHKNATCRLGNRLPTPWRKTINWLSPPSRSDLYQLAVDKALQSQNGHLDLFVRFLLGLAPMLEPQIRPPLNNVLPQLVVRETSIKNTVQYIKEVIKRDNSSERTINLFHCLNELGDHSLVEEINGYINSADKKKLTPAQCSALAYLLLMSAEELEEFDLKKYLRSEEGLHRMLPVVKVSRRAWLNQCQLTKASGKLLASVLQRTPSHLRELDLSDNDLQDEGVNLLCVGLGDPQCKLEILRLVGCGLTEKSGGVLAFALQSVNSHLRELDLSKNNLGDCGGKLGSDALNLHCTMETLRLAGCKLSEKPCEVVASAVQHMVSLTELDLSDNHMNITGIQLLNAGMCSPNCKLQKLRLVGCGLTKKSGGVLAFALQSVNSHLRELDLSKNTLRDCGGKLSSKMLNPHCTMETLRLADCKLKEKSCEIVISALQSANSPFRELDLSQNNLQASGKKLLSALQSPNCKLKTLRLVGCGLTKKSGDILAFALQSVNSHLRELDLSKNTLGDCGGKLGSGTLNPHCTMETLRLAGCKLSEKPCEVVASAVQHMVSLTELDLSDNHMNITGIQRLNAGICSPNCKLQKLRLVGCGLTEKSGDILAFALQSVNSHLRELDLSKNTLGDCGGKLSSGTLNPHCKIKTLRLAGCKLSEKPCEVVAFAVKHMVSLTELDLSGNHMNITGIQLLNAGICSPSCELQTLRLADCKLTEKSCEIVILALQSANSPLRELDLSQNDLKVSEEKLLSSLQSPKCKLETLRLVGCGLTEKSGGILAFALQSVNSHLRDLDLSKNTLGDCGGKLSSGTLNPHCKMETLRLASCKLTDESCEVVASAVQHVVSLTELDLSGIHMNITAVQLLSAGISHSNCKLQILRLAGCKLPEESCEVVASAVQHMVSLTELDLSGNHLNIAGVHLSSALKGDINCKLQILRHARGELRKYACELTLDPNTAHTDFSLSQGNRKVTRVSEQQPYPDHPERFGYWHQVLCREGLTGLCYWEAEWSGDKANIAVAYKSIQRKGRSDDSEFARNAKCWMLQCSSDSFSAWHNNKKTNIPAPSSRSSRVGVYLDWPAGTLSFYSVSSNTLTHLHTFHSTFTEPLYPGIGFGEGSDSVSLCQIT
ncbi:NACHT, LRR and PYD domains-containing protein 12-like isoform X1 [Sardina pilchardus]|uniref:NACHT, LRR and PYD domains-containing protein 12-like isoform X1 n=1 Tax=Sardina pilchardus TaxID=27697 RepID=UPI002E12FB19